MTFIARLVLSLAMLGFAAASTARAQSPEKYERERVVPTPKAQPVAPKKPAAVKPPATAPEPPAPNDQALVRELIRKAEAREPENGFCARGEGWPAGVTWFDTIKRAPPGGGMVATRFAGIKGVFDAYCKVSRVSAEFSENGRKTRRVESYSCTIGGSCAVLRAKVFETAPGFWGCDTEC